MLSFLLSGGNVPFLAALLLMLLVGAAELAGLGAGLAASADVDFDAEPGDASLLSWLNVGRLPLLMLLVVFLLVFGLVGLIGQRLVFGVFGATAPALIAAPVAFAAALPATRAFGRVVSRILPSDETSAVSRETLVGRVAVIVTGHASWGSPAQARVRDEHGQTHYVMVQPDDEGEAFDEGDSVILVRLAGAAFHAIRNTSASLGGAV